MELDMKIAREILTDKVRDYPTDHLRSELQILAYETPDALDVMATEVIRAEILRREGQFMLNPVTGEMRPA